MTSHRNLATPSVHSASPSAHTPSVHTIGQNSQMQTFGKQTPGSVASCVSQETPSIHSINHPKVQVFRQCLGSGAPKRARSSRVSQGKGTNYGTGCSSVKTPFPVKLLSKEPLAPQVLDRGPLWPIFGNPQFSKKAVPPRKSKCVWFRNSLILGTLLGGVLRCLGSGNVP